MTPFNSPQAAQRRRDRFFQGAVRDPDLQDANTGVARNNDHLSNSDPLIEQAEKQLHAAITNIAQSIGIPSLDKGVVDAMVKKATPSLRGMSRHQLASLSPSSSMLQFLAASTFNPAMTPEAVQRQRIEQIKASYNGTGITPTDAQLAGLDGGLLGSGTGRGGSGRGASGGFDYGGLSGRSYDGIQGAGYSGSIIGNFGVSNGSFTGMTAQVYRQNFQSYYGASAQGQWTATQVGTILGKNEGLQGAALAQRIKEVGHDTRTRLGLDTNIYAPKVANIGKKYSDPIIQNKANLDQAGEAFKRGDTAAAEQHERRFLDERKRLEDRVRREDPSKAGDVAGVYNGLVVEAMRNGWVPTEKNAKDVWKSVIDSSDPDAKKRVAEMVEAAKKSPAGAAMVQKLQPVIDDAQKAAAARGANETQQVAQETRQVAQETRAAETQTKVASAAGDIDNLASAPAATNKQKPDAASVVAPVTQKADAASAVAPVTQTADSKSASDGAKIAAAAAPETVTKPAVVAAAPAKKAAGPSVAT